VRVGGGLEVLPGSEDAVEGVVPSAFAAVVGAMGAFLWMGIGGMLEVVCGGLGCCMSCMSCVSYMCRMCDGGEYCRAPSRSRADNYFMSY